MNISFKTDLGRFNFRVAALIIKDNRLLIHTLKNSSFYLLPGGRVDIGEDSETSLLRELKEELKITASIDSLLWVSEGFFTHNDERFHELGYYYSVQCTTPNSILEKDSFEIEDEGNIFEFKWVSLDKLKDIEFYPLFVKDRILDLPKSIEKVVDLDNRLLLDKSRY
ncbi:MAG: NUDIX hydrolase [Clostridium sp.]